MQFLGKVHEYPDYKSCTVSLFLCIKKRIKIFYNFYFIKSPKGEIFY